MDTYLLVLAAVKGVGTIPGRTALQKTCYFAKEKVGGNLAYFAHYFGPYSKAVAKARSDLVASNILREEVEVGKLTKPRQTEQDTEKVWQRHNYVLTKEGTDLIDRLKDKLGGDFHTVQSYVKTIESATGMDLTRLAAAAKVHFVSIHEGAATIDEIVERASAHDWRLSTDDVSSAMDTLDEIELELSIS